MSQSAETPAKEAASRYALIGPGDPAPWFYQRATSHERYAFDTVGGRYVVMLFLGTAGDQPGRSAIETILAHREIFDDQNFCFFGISLDPSDEREGRLREFVPGIRY